jgi:hypothetical protein
MDSAPQAPAPDASGMEIGFCIIDCGSRIADDRIRIEEELPVLNWRTERRWVGYERGMSPRAARDDAASVE